ncbi:alpha/beta fold hydrolase [Brucella sp. NM4]|uniref:alpha/beta fold hydrolase n=1 Tax=Brucella sp. NM4 TaxID=3045175 RepID=UPI0024BC5DD3|nr:alpha/beta fold hydrolase [Brucella sp. NM4]WHS30564.1 alpha/beta fold hydrolase [Brucella sp. NM4]
MLFSSPVLAQENVLPSINTPPEVSKANLAKVKAEKRGQYAVPEGFESGMVETDGIRLHYVRGGEGKGDPIIFVHGFGSTWKMWQPALEKFSANHQVIAIDLPGLGQSEPSAKRYDAEQMSAYLLGAIKSLTDNQPFTYVCHDLCNSASYPMVANNQDIIKKVVFMDLADPRQGDVDLSRFDAKWSGPRLAFRLFLVRRYCRENGLHRSGAVHELLHQGICGQEGRLHTGTAG